MLAGRFNKIRLLLQNLRVVTLSYSRVSDYGLLEIQESGGLVVVYRIDTYFHLQGLVGKNIGVLSYIFLMIAMMTDEQPAG